MRGGANRRPHWSNFIIPSIVKNIYYTMKKSKGEGFEMLQLLAAYSIQEIVTFFIMLVLAIKGGADLVDWFRDRYQRKFDKDYIHMTKQEHLEEHYRKCSEQHAEFIERYSDVEKKIDSLAQNFNNRLDNLEKAIKQLTESDMHDIKGWIVEKHHHFTTKGWVDDFTMDTLEKRYSDYKQEGGNSYVEGLMRELRALPHVAPGSED